MGSTGADTDSNRRHVMFCAFRGNATTPSLSPCISRSCNSS